jgi:hypothetical protein
MVIDPQTIGKVADATTALAQTGGKAIDATTGFAKIFKGPVAALIGCLEDKFKYVRWERQQALIDKAETIMRAKRIPAPTRELPLPFAVPLLTAAVLEGDDDLQETWARLLVNAGDSATEMELRTAYVEILRGMSAFDVRILSKLAEATLKAPPGARSLVSVKDLPEYSQSYPSAPADDLPTELLISLANLSRLGCVAPSSGFGGGVGFSHVHVTELGLALYRACS